MTDHVKNVYLLDAEYKPFPPFDDWLAQVTVDTTRWERYKNLLDEAKKRPGSVVAYALQAAKRAAAIDTGAIEGLYKVDRGFTYTVAFEMSAWQTQLSIPGEKFRPLFEAQLRAYDYVLDLATTSEPVSSAAIRKLHEVVCEAQDTYRVMTAVGPQEQPLPKGRYKSSPNHVLTRDGRNHSYAPVDVTADEVARLVHELQSETFLAAHPVLQASYAHYCFVVIHPFADGNGRLARALASIFTYRSVSIPIVILSEHKDSYLDSLESADNMNHQAFVDFMMARTLDTIQLVDEGIRGGSLPQTDELLRSFENLYITRGGFTYDQIDDAGATLLSLIIGSFGNKISAITNEKLGGHITQSSDHYPAVAAATHRMPLKGGKAVTLNITSRAPASGNVVQKFVLILPKDGRGDDNIQFRRPDGNETFSARVDELIPSVAGLLQVRISMFVDRIVNDMLIQLRDIAKKALS